MYTVTQLPDATAPYTVAYIPDLPFEQPVRLAHAPLKSMLGQVRFAYQADLANPGNVSELYKTLQGQYPRMLEEPQATIILGAGEVKTQQSSVNWRLTDFER